MLFTKEDYRFLLHNGVQSQHQLDRALSQLFIEHAQSLSDIPTKRALNILLMSHTGNLDALITMIDMHILEHDAYTLSASDHDIVAHVQTVIRHAETLYDGLLVACPSSTKDYADNTVYEKGC